MERLYRIVYRPGNNASDYKLHIGRKGTVHYTTLGAAKSAITQFKKRDRYYGGGIPDYKIQVVTLPQWVDVDDD